MSYEAVEQSGERATMNSGFHSFPSAMSPRLGGLEVLNLSGDVTLSPVDVGALVREALQGVSAGVAYGQKVVLQPKDEELGKLVCTSELAERFTGERLNWKLSALVGLNERYGSVKIVGSNAYNRVLGLPRSRSTILLFDKLTMQPLCILDGTEISAARTGAYASVVMDLLLGHEDAMSVFVFGAGKIAEKVAFDLQAHHAPRVRALYVKSRTEENARRFAQAVSRHVTFPVVPSVDGSELGRCAYVVTASNARHPLYERSSLSPTAVVLHLGGDETPAAYIRQCLEAGTVLCDDVHAVSHRNSQSLALYFSRANKTLEDEAAKYRVLDVWDVIGRPPVAYRLPALVTCVGLPVLDLYLAQRLFEMTLETADAARKARKVEHVLS